MSENYIHMEIREIQTSEDPSDLPIVILQEVGGTREFPVFIGHVEAKALDEAAVADNHSLSNPLKRPLTHDLILNTLDALAGTLVRILIPKLENGTFFGTLEVKTENGSVVEIDSRPSDAMVISVKRKVPIYVEASVLTAMKHDS